MTWSMSTLAIAKCPKQVKGPHLGLKFCGVVNKTDSRSEFYILSSYNSEMLLVLRNPMAANVLSTGDSTAKNTRLTETQQIDLYKRIQAFEIDEEEVQLSFSMRLARENAWTVDYACQVIEEYKKFVFLWMVMEHPVTPSDQVDQVWHLHLTYTRSYWERFCDHALQAHLHHEPTKGGSAESEKFDGWYRQTLQSYEMLFGEPPPKDIWPSPADRFGRDLNFVRANTQQKWIVPKPPISKDVVAGVFAATLFFLGLYYANISGKVANPIGGLLISIVAATAGFSLIQFLAKALDSLNSPSLPAHLSGGCALAGENYIGCGGG